MSVGTSDLGKILTRQWQDRLIVSSLQHAKYVYFVNQLFAGSKGQRMRELYEPTSDKPSLTKPAV
jgi:hypothetical protein